VNSLDEELIALDHALWQAAKDRRLDDFRGMMAEDYQGLYARGFVTAADDASTTGTMMIRRFHFEDFRVRDLGGEAALATYITVLDASVGGGRDISGRYASTSVWQRLADGGRVLVYHAESRLA
jgi:hypothetical protein